MKQPYFGRSPRRNQRDDESCDFCGIVSGRIQRIVHHEDENLMVFKNKLTWTPVMLLVIPKVHMSQQEFWTSAIFSHASSIAVKIARELCLDGFRLVSNFGDRAAQTQSHGHVHILGGSELGLYMDFPRKGDYWLRRFGYTEYQSTRAHEPSSKGTSPLPRNHPE